VKLPRGLLDSVTEMNAEEFRLLRDLIHQHCGIYFRDDMRFLLERRLTPRLRVHRLGDYLSYHRLLRFDPGRMAELDAAVELLTTNETYFFREPEQLASFTNEILPMLAEERRATRKLRIWSAGCSSGEECYTLAILIADSGLFQGWDVEIFGCDISRRVIATARSGVYGPNALRATTPEMLNRWFRPEGTRWAVAESLRRMVSFGQLNLLDREALGLVGKVDVVFCRNVMIYFDMPARKQLLRGFHDKLEEGGFLLLGHSESLINITADFELVHLRHDLVYRKPRGSER
jgi:chemotaxis protein methyltransferase CheR